MTNNNAHIKYQAYDNPEAILTADDLSFSEKEELLKAWRVDAEALARASAEGLNGGEDASLKGVTDALMKLRKEKN